MYFRILFNKVSINVYVNKYYVFLFGRKSLSCIENFCVRKIGFETALILHDIYFIFTDKVVQCIVILYC